MGTAYLAVSTGSLLLETILQLCVVGTHSGDSEALFVVLLALVMAPIIIVNFVSAIQVTRTKDFSGKDCGRALCIGLHSFQVGIVWRSLKLWVEYDERDWLDLLGMRLFHSGLQSIPFSVILAVTLFLNNSNSALDIITITVSLISASVALVTYRSGTKLYEPIDEEDTHARTKAIRLRVGVVFLTLSTFLVLVARFVSLVLFAVAQTYFVFIPIGLHFIIHLFIETCRIQCSEDGTLSKVGTAVYVAFVNVFDMVGVGYTGVKCSYVFYYAVMLIENLGLSFYWMLTVHQENESQSKLLVVLAVILCFIFGLILKFASCGCIFNIESDILSDAFNNPELKDDKMFQKVEQPLNNTIEIIADSNDHALYEHELPRNHNASPHLNSLALHVDSSPMPSGVPRRPKRPTLSSSTSSSLTASRQHDYDNQAFVRSQGNISISSHHTIHSKGSSSQGHSADRSREISVGSGGSGSKGRKDKLVNVDHHGQGRTTPKLHVINNSSSEQISDIQHSRIAKVKPTIIVSDTSKHDTLPRKNNAGPSAVKASNLTLASSHSKHSRNTHTETLPRNNRHYSGYNGFEDPYREQKQLNLKKPQNNRFHHPQPRQYLHPHHQHPQTHNQHQHTHHHQQRKHRHHHHPRHRRQTEMDYSLDSSELYPSMTSDSSSVSTYTDAHDRNWRRHRNKHSHTHAHHRNRGNGNLDTRDGYSTDVSNSDYISCNDFSMEDSSSWTESSESSSDGAATWPPSHTTNLLKMYNIPDRESSTDNILHWLEAMDHELTESMHEASFSTMREPSIASETDTNMSAMKTFEVKKEKKKFKRLMAKPKGLFLKFSSLNYKGKDKKYHERPFPLRKTTPMPQGGHQYEDDRAGGFEGRTHIPDRPVSAVPLPGDNVQESIV